MEESSKDNKYKKQKNEYTVIRKFNNDGLSFQKAMEQLLTNPPKCYFIKNI